MCMRRLIIYILSWVLFLSVIPPVGAQSEIAEGQEHIRRFQETIWIHRDGTITVKEHIDYDFGNDERHGIYRDIPTIRTNKDGKKYRMDFQIDQVINEQGEAYTFDVSGKDTLHIKIGDPDKTITGKHTYVITYTVRGALTYFSDHDELYWNTTGNAWNIPITAVSQTIYLPPQLDASTIRALCYSGYEGSTEQNCTTAVEGHQVVVNTTQTLQSNQGLTSVVRFEKGIVSIVEATEVRDFYTTVWGKFVIALGIIALVFWYILLPLWLPIKWWIHGRDPKHPEGPVRAWFDPPETKSGRALTPAETGTLVDEHAATREISAVVVSLAQRGYLKIVEKDKSDYEFIKTKNIGEQDNLMHFERTFLTELFSGKDVVRLKEAKLSDEVEKVQKALYEELVKEGYFPENPDKMRKRYAILAGLGAVTFNFFLLISASVFGRLMPRKTMLGVEATNKAKSLRNFLTSQERQLAFQAKNQMMFEKLLPFAIAFGVEKIWADRFKDIALTPPEWYVSHHHGVFNSQSFTRGLSSSMSSFKSAATPVSSSTGHSSGFSGGSSGGGGGGGGGGSW